MRRVTPIVVALVGLVSPAARAQIDLGRALPELEGEALPSVLSQRVSVFATEPVPGAFSVAPGIYAVERSAAGLGELARERPELELWWSPPRRLLLERADGWIQASSFRRQTQLRGRGVVVGIIDSGVDPAHPDLREADGRTRVRWWLDFSRPPADRHPELESDLGCTADVECAVLSGDDIDELLNNDVPDDEPRDTFGHGTHVASLAAGNGLSDDPPVYVGVAPEATLIVARVARSGGSGIFDADVLKAARFVFERAEALGMPAVVNLSLGSDFGGHDGSSIVEQGLSSLVGPNFPGRAIVVAAGNSAGLYSGVGPDFPDPVGVHTEVHVPREGEALVPLFTPATRNDETRGTVYVWIESREGDELEIGVDDGDGTVFAPLPPGRSGMIKEDGIEVSVINQTVASVSRVTRGLGGAVVVIDGRWPAERRFSIRLQGHGTAQLWVQSEGDLSPEASVGALLPRAFKEGTINIPASAPDLIAVGASLNRTRWEDYEGNLVSLPEHGALDDAPDDTTAYFSSAGPNALGVMKPELVAPGANVIGAMSSWADPLNTGGASAFGSFGRCPADTAEECFVVDDYHAVTGGTSMAAPIVAGAVALLLERDPTLSQLELRALLQAGARPLEGAVFSEQQVGAGGLDLEGILLAQLAGEMPSDRVPGSRSWVALAASFARPEPTSSLGCLLELRDDDLAVVDGFAPERLTLDVSGADVVEPLTRIAPGLHTFALAAPSGSGGSEIALRVRFDGQVIVSRSIPIAVDHALSVEDPAARGGCAVAGARTGSGLALLGLVLAAGLVRRRARGATGTRLPRAARTVSRPGRRGARG